MADLDGTVEAWDDSEEEDVETADDWDADETETAATARPEPDPEPEPEPLSQGTVGRRVKKGKKRQRDEHAHTQAGEAGTSAAYEEETEHRKDDSEVDVAPSRKKLRKKDLAKLEAARAAQYSELEQREARHSKMGATLQRLGMEKALMGKGAKRKLKPKPGKEGAPRQFKWKQRRQK